MLKKFLSYSGAEALSKGLNWGTIALLPFFLKTEQLGFVGLLLAIEGILGNMLLLGQEKSIFKFYNNKEFSVLNYTIRIVLITSVISFILLAVFRGFKYDFFGIKIFPHLFVLLVSILFHNYSRLLMAQSRIEENVSMFWKTRLLYQILKSLLVLGFIAFSGNGLGYLYASLAAGCIFVLLYRKVLIEAVGTDHAWKFFKHYPVMVTFGAPLVFHAMSGNILSYADRFFLEEYLDMRTLGIYTFVYSIGSSIFFFYGAMSSYFEPLVYKYQHNIEAYRSVLRFYLLFVLTLALLMALAIDTLFEPVILSMVGSEYALGTSCLRFILVAHLLIPFYTVANYELAVSGRTKTIAFFTLIAATINLLLNSILIPKYGMEGAAAATLVTYLILSIITHLGIQIMVKWHLKYLLFVLSVLGILLLILITQLLSANYMVFQFIFSVVLLVLLSGLTYKHYLTFGKIVSSNN